MTDLKLVALDVDGVLREGSKLFYKCHKKAMETEGLGEEFGKYFDVKDLWHFKGLGKFSDKRDALDVIYTLAKAKNLDKLHDLICLPDADERISRLVGSDAQKVDKAILDKMVKAYQEVATSPGSYGLVGLYPESEKIVMRIKESGKMLAIFTNANLITLERDLKGLLKHFDYIVTPREVKISKPSGEGLTLIAKRGGVDIGEMIYVGDTVVDIRAARDAKCRSIAVYSGMGLRQHLERERPDYIFKDLKEASKLILEM